MSTDNQMRPTDAARGRSGRNREDHGTKEFQPTAQQEGGNESLDRRQQAEDKRGRRRNRNSGIATNTTSDSIDDEKELASADIVQGDQVAD
jgi:hypothetical protein